MGMLDADEFVVLRGAADDGRAPDLRAFLAPFEAHGGLVVSGGGAGANGRAVPTPTR